MFLPGWEEGLFPHQRALDEGGSSGLEEERRLAYVGLTRAKQRPISGSSPTAASTACGSPPSPRASSTSCPPTMSQIAEAGQNYGGYGHNAYGASRFDKAASARPEAFSGNYSTPGWQRAQQNRTGATSQNWGIRSGANVERVGYGETDSGFGAGRGSVKGRTIDGELVAKSVATSRRGLPWATGYSPEIRQRQHRGDRGQQVDHRLR